MWHYQVLQYVIDWHHSLSNHVVYVLINNFLWAVINFWINLSRGPSLSWTNVKLRNLELTLVDIHTLNFVGLNRSVVMVFAFMLGGQRFESQPEHYLRESLGKSHTSVHPAANGYQLRMLLALSQKIIGSIRESWE